MRYLLFLINNTVNKLCDDIGWKYIGYTNESGIYELECPNKHQVLKEKRNISNAHCKHCK